MRPIVVTGIGLATPLGSTREETWGKIRKGESILANPCDEFLGEEFSPYARACRFPQGECSQRIFALSLRSVEEAISDSAIDVENFSGERIGSTISVSKPLLSETLSGILSGDSVGRFLSEKIGFSGPNTNVIAACATGVHSLLLATRWLERGECDVAIAGSVESSLHELWLAGFKRMGVLSEFPCPFDRRRKGFMIGEGAGILVLERKSDALARRARIYAEVIDGAVGSDCYHPASFDPEGKSIASVLRRAFKQVREVDYMNLHGTGTPLNDLSETRAIKDVFGEKGYDLSLSSTKASTGHLLGAAGSVETAITCLALRDSFVPPTLNLEEQDPECDLDYTPLKGKNKRINLAANLSFGFGGPIGAIVLQKV